MEKYKEQKWSGQKGKKFGHAGRVEDPYLPEAGQEASLCTQCHALYQEKRWSYDQKLYDRLAGTGRVREVICPACRKVNDGYAEGYLSLSGEFFNQHRDEIIKLLEKEASRVSARSVLDRIIRMAPEGADTLVVETTTDKLVQRLGRAVHRAYKGDLKFHWGEMDYLVRVYWGR